MLLLIKTINDDDEEYCDYNTMMVLYMEQLWLVYVWDGNGITKFKDIHGSLDENPFHLEYYPPKE
jgi:hypothetical protein